MADSNAQPHVQTLWEPWHDHPLFGLRALKKTFPELFDDYVPPALMSPVPMTTLGSLATLPTSWPANTEEVPTDRRVSPREPANPRPAPTPLSPQDAAMQALQNMIDLADQREAYLQQTLQRRQEFAEKLQQVATSEHKLQAASQPVRSCRHCNRPLYIHLADSTLEPCTRSNRFCCGYDPEGQLVGYLDCIQGRNAAKSRRKYAARKAQKHAGNMAPVFYMVDGKARSQ